MSKEVIKLSATWCGPCKQYAPTFDKLTPAMEAAGWTVSVLDIDDKEGKQVASSFGVRGVPCTIVLTDDKEPVVHSGVMFEAQLSALLEL